MKCPFCDNDITPTLRDRLLGGLRCSTCSAFVDKSGDWHNSKGISHFQHRLNSKSKRGTLGRITATDQSFSYDGNQYPYDLVAHLLFFWNHTQIKTSLNYIPTGTTHEHHSMLVIQMTDKTQFTIKAGAKGPTIDIGLIPGGIIHAAKELMSEQATGLSAKKQCEELCIVSRIIHEATYEHRVYEYFKMYHNDGCIIYGNHKIYSNGDISDGRKTLNLYRAKIVRHPYSVHLSAQPSSLAQHLLGNKMDIPLTLDNDAITAVFINLFKVTI
jgi:hypothetical protein